MRWFWYTCLALFSIGFLGVMAVIAGAVYAISYYGQDLPEYSQLQDYKPPVMTRIYAGDGGLVTEYAEENRVFVPIDSIPDHIRFAFISAEDQNFYRHNGIDYLAIVRAAVTNLRNFGSGRRPEGASTITQQVAKNFLLSSEVSFQRKIREAILAFRMERALSKDRLLELYLNEIYLGYGSYGVAAASLNYFNKALEQLEIHEVAYLAALPKAPNNYHPTRRPEAALARRNWVLDRMAANDYITSSQAETAKLKPLGTHVRNQVLEVDAQYFAEDVRRQIVERYGFEALYGGGLAVRTSINPQLQGIAERTLRDGLEAYDRRQGWRGPVTHFESLDDWAARLADVGVAGLRQDWRLAAVLEVEQDSATLGFADRSRGTLALDEVKWARKHLGPSALGPAVNSVRQVVSVGDVVIVKPVKGEDDQENRYSLRQIPAVNGALVAMDPHTGRVLAMQGGWSYTQSEFNRATQARRQPGSAFKPFVYLAALDKGFTPATLVLDAPFVIDQGPGLPKWRPSNYSNEYYGPTPIRVGVEKSRNLMTVRLAHFVGMDNIIDISQRFGVIDDMPPFLAHSLGSGETTLLKLTTGYAQLVNGGKKITPTLIDRIQDRTGANIFVQDNRSCDGCGSLVEWTGQDVPAVPDTREQLADPRKAYQMVSILEGVVERGTGTRIRALGRPLAGKTGTTNESRDTWFVGFSPDLAVGVFVGFDDPKPMGRRETGSSVAVPIFRDFMEEALKDQPAIPFRVPPGIRQVMINAENGARARPGDKNTIWEAFLTGTEPTDDIYILDGNGISLMSTLSGGFGSTGGGLVDGPAASRESVTTGTGGLY